MEEAYWDLTIPHLGLSVLSCLNEASERAFLLVGGGRWNIGLETGCQLM